MLRKKRKKNIPNRNFTKKIGNDQPALETTRSPRNIKLDKSFLRVRSFPADLIDSLDDNQIILLSDNDDYTSVMGVDRRGRSILMLNDIFGDFDDIVSDLIEQLENTEITNSKGDLTPEQIVIVVDDDEDSIADGEDLIGSLIDEINDLYTEQPVYQIDRTEEIFTDEQEGEEIALRFFLEEFIDNFDEPEEEDNDLIEEEDLISFDSDSEERIDNSIYESAIAKEVRFRELTDVEILIEGSQTISEQIYYPFTGILEEILDDENLIVRVSIDNLLPDIQEFLPEELDEVRMIVPIEAFVKTEVSREEKIYIEDIKIQLIAREEVLADIENRNLTIQDLEESAILGDREGQLQWISETINQRQQNTNLEAINSQIVNDLDQLKIIDARDDDNSPIWEDIDRLLANLDSSAIG